MSPGAAGHGRSAGIKSMNTCPFSENSIIRRVNVLRRLARQRKKFVLFKNKTDRALAHRQISSGYSLMVYFAVMYWIGRSSYFSHERGVFKGWVIPCCVVLYFIWLLYSTFKLRWACKVFDVYGAEMVSEIESRLAEQGADGKPPSAAQPPHNDNPNTRLP